VLKIAPSALKYDLYGGFMTEIQETLSKWCLLVLASFCLPWSLCPAAQVEDEYEPAVDAAVRVAQILTATTPIFLTVAGNRWADANGSGADPFIEILDDHFRQSKVADTGFRIARNGVACGVDHTWPVAGARNSLSLGALAGYLDGRIHPFESDIAGKQKFFSGAVFAAYESFEGNALKTNVNLFAGLQRMENKLPTIDGDRDGIIFQKMISNGQFVVLEGTKILCRWKNLQVGPWVMVSYDHVNQKIRETPLGTCEFLDTTIGITLEKECQRNDGQRHIPGAFLKCGWQQQQIFHAHTDVMAYPGRNSFVIINGLHAHLNSHWTVAANFQAALAKDQNTYALSVALGRNFFGLMASAREQVIGAHGSTHDSDGGSKH
jgi:hypothetical protein